MTTRSLFHYDGPVVSSKPIQAILVLLLVLFILCIPAFLLSSNLRWAINAASLYTYGFDKHGVSETTGLTPEELAVTARDMIHYLNSRDEPIEMTVSTPDGRDLFNEREVDHMRDVKELVGLCYCVQVGTAAYIAAFALGGLVWRRRRFVSPLLWGLLGGGVATLALLLAVGLTALVDFDWLLLGFHKLFFMGSDTWILNPATDYLIMLFPWGFFYDSVLYIAGATVVEALIVGGVAGLLLWRRKRGES